MDLKSIDVESDIDRGLEMKEGNVEKALCVWQGHVGRNTNVKGTSGEVSNKEEYVTVIWGKGSLYHAIAKTDTLCSGVLRTIDEFKSDGLGCSAKILRKLFKGVAWFLFAAYKM